MLIRENIHASRFLAGAVMRYATWPTLNTQTVAQHAWRVACIVVEVFGLPRAEVLYYALHHDSGEMWAGDLPFGIKQQVPGLKEAMNSAEATGLKKLDLKLPVLSELEKLQIKAADLLEMFEFGSHEVRMGNSYATPIVNDTLAAVQRLGLAIADKNQSEQFAFAVNKWLTNYGDNA